MISFLSYLLLESPFDDAKKKWNADLFNYIHKDIDYYITAFKKLRDSNQISGQEKDISYWIPKGLDQFADFINKTNEEVEHKQLLKSKEKDAIKVFENKEVAVYNIQSYEASCKYGAGTKWCIASNTEKHWNSYYNKQHLTFYYIIAKDLPPTEPYYKIAVSVYPEKLDGIAEVYDATDNLINDKEFHEILREDGIPEDIFVPREIITFKKTLEGKPIEEQNKLIEEKWDNIDASGLEILIWSEDFKSARIAKYKDVHAFAEKCGNDTAKWCAKILFGEERLEYDYVSDDDQIKDCFDMLDTKKVEKYLEENYPDEDDREQWEDDAFEFLKDQSDDVYDNCRSAAFTGSEYGAEAEMLDDFKSGLEDIEWLDSNNTEMDYNVFVGKDIWNEPFELFAYRETIINVCNDEEFIEEMEQEGYGFSFKVDEPYNGWYGWDEEAAKERLKDEDTTRNLM
jgi:hypothetical protein